MTHKMRLNECGRDELVKRVRESWERGKLTRHAAGHFWTRACIPTITDRMAVLPEAGVPEDEIASLAGRFS